MNRQIESWFSQQVYSSLKIMNWKDIRKIVNIADKLLNLDVISELPESCKTEEGYYNEILNRYLSFNEKNREEITEEYLLQNGFSLDKETIKFLSMEDEKIYQNDDHRIQIVCGWTNRYGLAYSVHIDNANFETIGTMDCKYIDELETFINLVYV